MTFDRLAQTLILLATLVSGVASWYDYHPGQAAAGPQLRAALGPHWRGQTVRVCARVCIRVRLTDFMRADRLVDLDRSDFARLAPLSVGVVHVTVTPVSAAIATPRPLPTAPNSDALAPQPQEGTR